MVLGYTTGVFDLFHYGHVNLLRNARNLCDKLVVGVTVDELVQYKGKTAFVPFEDRIRVVEACRYVDVVIPQYDLDKAVAMKKIHAQVLFVGDDWYESDSWRGYEQELKKLNCKVIYFPYTRTISSTKINDALNMLRQ